MDFRLWFPLVVMVIALAIVGAVISGRKISGRRSTATLLLAALFGLAGGFAFAIPRQADSERETRIQGCMAVMGGTDAAATARACDSIDPAEHREAADRMLKAGAR